jgi:hypothetical protein
MRRAAFGQRTLPCRSSGGHLGSNNITAAHEKGYGAPGHAAAAFGRAPFAWRGVRNGLTFAFARVAASGRGGRFSV